jgi:phospholipid N-methyltransferase
MEQGGTVVEKTPSRGEQLLLFARNFLKHPKMLGSVIPSSRFLIEEVLEPIDWKRARVIVEYGPGVGTITAELLRRMQPDASLIVVETNPEFVRFLQAAFRDKRLHVVHGSAAEIDRILRERGHEKADYILSGIPFSTMPETLRESILRTTRAVLQTDGAFLVYQFSARVLPDLKRIFPHVERGFEPLNILPAHLFFCESKAA